MRIWKKLRRLLTGLWLDKLCKLCLVHSRTKDLIDLGCPEKVPQLLRFLADVIGKSRTEAFSESFDYIKVLLNSADPYKERKKELNKATEPVAYNIRRYLAHKSWNLKEALRISAAANIIDTSVLGYESRDLVEAIWEKPALEEHIEIPKNVYIILDNAGEALIDVALAEIMKRRGHEVIMVVRKESYEIDVLRDDLEAEGIEIMETQGSTPPVLHVNGFLIAKGIANLEACIERGRMESLHLFRAKCDVLARMFKVPKNAPVIISRSKVEQYLKGS